MIDNNLEDGLKLAKNKKKSVFVYVSVIVLLLIVLFLFLISKGIVKINNSGDSLNPDALNNGDTDSVFQDMVNSEHLKPSNTDSTKLSSRNIGDYLLEQEIPYNERSGLENKDGVEIWYGIDIISSGSIYTENINDGKEDLTRLFKMKAKLSSGEDVEMVIGVDNPEIENWWIYSAMSTSGSRYTNDDIKKVREGEVNIELLEDIFSEGYRWRYYFYFSSNLECPDSYNEVANAYLGDYTPGIIINKIGLGDLKDIRLFPYQINAIQ